MDVLPAVCSRAVASPGARRSGLGPADAIDHIGSVDIFADESDALQGRCPAWQGAGGVDTAGSRERLCRGALPVAQQLLQAGFEVVAGLFPLGRVRLGSDLIPVRRRSRAAGEIDPAGCRKRIAERGVAVVAGGRVSLFATAAPSEATAIGQIEDRSGENRRETQRTG